MAVLPLSKLPMDFGASPHNPTTPAARKEEPANWLRFASAATLVAGGALLLSGRKRVGLVIAATGATMAMIDQQEAIKEWWAEMPRYIGEAQKVLTQICETVDELAVQREKLGRVLGR